MKKGFLFVACFLGMKAVTSQNFKVFRSPFSEGMNDKMAVIDHAAEGTTMVGATYAWGAGAADGLITRLDGYDNILWQKSYGGTGSDIPTCADTLGNGDYIVGGWSDSDNSFLMRIQDNGDTVWTKSLQSVEANMIWDVKRADDSTFFVCGYHGGITSASKMFIAQMNNNGTMLWSKTFDGSTYFEARKMFIQHGRLYLLGYAFGGSLSSMCLLRLDYNGNIKWQKRYRYPSHHHEAFSVMGFSNTDLMVSGYMIDSTDTDIKSFYTRIDSSGNVVWAAKFIEQPPAFKFIQAPNAMVGHDDNVYACGFVNDSGYTPKPYEALSVKIDGNTGDTLWTRVYQLGTYASFYNTLAKPGGMQWLGLVSYPAPMPMYNLSRDPFMLSTGPDGYTDCNRVNRILLYEHISWTVLPAAFSTSPVTFNELPAHFAIGEPMMYDSLICVTNIGVPETETDFCLEIYPNPAGEQVIVSACEMVSRINLYDAAGKCVFSKGSNSTSIPLDFTGLGAGMYFMQVQTVKGIATEKIIVE